MHIVIVGNGISGVTAARYIRKQSSHKITIISSETEYFFSRTALMYVYMGHMKYEHTKPYEDSFWKKNGIELLQDYVNSIDFENKALSLEKHSSINYDKLILATGSSPNKFGWPGQDLKGVQGLYSYQDLETMEHYTKGIERAVVVGGGLIGIEMVEMLTSRDIQVTFLVREKSFWDTVLPKQESELINRHIQEHHIDLRLSTELKEIHDDGTGQVKSIITNMGEEIACGFVGLTTGVNPNVGFVKNTPLNINRGILVDEMLETNIADVFAIGDCVEHKNPPLGRRNIEQVWYTGRIMGETVAKTICGNPTRYQPGIWFNSAKFFDIEYQTYGAVGSSLSENEEEFYWEHSSGKKCMHFMFNKKTNELIGVNTFGIRLRHEVFNNWLVEKKTIQYVIQNLKKANFDPEFFTKYEVEIGELFNQKFPNLQVNLKKSKGILANLLS